MQITLIKIAKSILLLLFTVWLLSCASNESIIRHQPSGTVVKIYDGIRQDEAKKLVDYIYVNFDEIHARFFTMEKFAMLDSIHTWPKDAQPQDLYDYLVDFKRPNPVDECCSFMITELFIKKNHNTFSVDNFQIYMTDSQLDSHNLVK